jgi:Zn-dependent protease
VAAKAARERSELDANQFLEVAVGFMVFVFSVVVHENAHGLAAERYGDPTARALGRITMNPLPHIDPIGSVVLPLMAFVSGIPFIGWAKPVPVNSANLRNPVVHNAYVAAAGPASNFVLALAGTVLWIVVGLAFKHFPALLSDGGRSLVFFNTLFSRLILINCVLGIFNLIPVPPLDGHWILFRYLPSRYAEMLAMIRPYGFFILILLLWTGVIGMVIRLPLVFLYGGLRSFVASAVGMF